MIHVIHTDILWAYLETSLPVYSFHLFNAWPQKQPGKLWRSTATACLLLFFVFADLVHLCSHMHFPIQSSVLQRRLIALWETGLLRLGKDLPVWAKVHLEGYDKRRMLMKTNSLSQKYQPIPQIRVQTAAGHLDRHCQTITWQASDSQKGFWKASAGLVGSLLAFRMFNVHTVVWVVVPFCK